MEHSLFGIIFAAALANNFILAKFLGLCPFFGVSKQKQAAFGMSLAVIFVMTITAVTTYPIFGLLVQLKLEFLNILAFILVIAGMVQFAEKVIKKFSPTLYQQLGIYLPLITTNCAVLGVAFLGVDPELNFTYVEAIIYAFGSAVGWSFVLIAFSFIREKLELNNTPKSLKGLPIAFIMAGLMAIGFMGFIGMFK